MIIYLVLRRELCPWANIDAYHFLLRMPLSSKDENAVSFDTANYNCSSAQPQPQLLATQPWYIRPRWSLSIAVTSVFKSCPVTFRPYSICSASAIDRSARVCEAHKNQNHTNMTQCRSTPYKLLLQWLSVSRSHLYCVKMITCVIAHFHYPLSSHFIPETK